MNLITVEVVLILFSIGMASIVAATFLIFWKRKSGVEVYEVFKKGSFVYRELDGLIDEDYVMPVKVLTYIGLLIILLAIFSLPWKR